MLPLLIAIIREISFRVRSDIGCFFTLNEGVHTNQVRVNIPRFGEFVI